MVITERKLNKTDINDVLHDSKNAEFGVTDSAHARCLIHYQRTPCAELLLRKSTFDDFGMRTNE